MKSSKAQITAKFHKIPTIRFEDQQLTSFSGLLVFQLLFKRLNLKRRLKKCFAHLKVSPIFGRHLIVLLLVIHLLIGFRRLREVDYYHDWLKNRKLHIVLCERFNNRVTPAVFSDSWDGIRKRILDHSCLFN